VLVALSGGVFSNEIIIPQENWQFSCGEGMYHAENEILHSEDGRTIHRIPDTNQPRMTRTNK